MEALIITIPKPGKPPHLPFNFCHISLLYTDIGVYAKITAAILENIPLLIHPDQVGFVKGCQASDGTRYIVNLLYPTERLLCSSSWMWRRRSTVFIGYISGRYYIKKTSKVLSQPSLPYTPPPAQKSTHLALCHNLLISLMAPDMAVPYRQ